MNGFIDLGWGWHPPTNNKRWGAPPKGGTPKSYCWWVDTEPKVRYWSILKTNNILAVRSLFIVSLKDGISSMYIGMLVEVSCHGISLPTFLITYVIKFIN